MACRQTAFRQDDASLSLTPERQRRRVVGRSRARAASIIMDCRTYNCMASGIIIPCALDLLSVAVLWRPHESRMSYSGTSYQADAKRVIVATRISFEGASS